MGRNYTDEDIVNAVESSFSVAQVLKRLGLSPTGGNYVGMHDHFRRLGLDTSHFTGQGHLRGKRHNWTPERPLADVLVQNSDYRCRSNLKKRLIRAGILVNCCSVCGLPPVWQGKPLVLILDHINGDRSDNRIENLRLVCPNCNSQQPTFAGKNKGRYSGVLSGDNSQDSGVPTPRQVIPGRRKETPAAPNDMPMAPRACADERVRFGPPELEPETHHRGGSGGQGGQELPPP